MGFASEIETFSRSLAECLESKRQDWIGAIGAESGYSLEDVEEIFDSCLLLLRSFRRAPLESRSVPNLDSSRQIELVWVPWGTIVAILPGNAFLYLGLTVCVNALAAGNQVILRIPRGAETSGKLLDSALAESGVGDLVSLVAEPAADLLRRFGASPEPGLVHYFGGSGRIDQLLADCFKAGKGCLAEGEGNTWVYVGPKFDPVRAATILVEGSTRYRGETCTSINGAIIHPERYQEVIDAIPVESSRVDLSMEIRERVAEAGGRTRDFGSGVIVESPNPVSDLVRQGVFGPVLWVSPGTEADFQQLWPINEFPLCAAVLANGEPCDWAWRLANLSRLVVDGDPSIEDPLEPWGGYPRSGSSLVAPWVEKYSRVVQIDRARI